MINRDSEVTAQPNQALQPLLNPNLDAAPVVKEGKTERLKCLDVYRGLTILGMAFADHIGDVGGGFWWLVHPEWNGLTLADLVFPAFLFIMGVAIPLATSKSRPIRPKNVSRVFLLFAIGLILNLIGSRGFSNLRIMGILQRMSLCYGIVLLIHWWTDYGTHQIRRRVGALVMVAFVILYIALMLPWEDPSIGCYRSHNLELFCNFAGYVDRAAFGVDHLYDLTDPEGIVSTLTATFTTYVGYCFGLLLLKHKKHLDTLIKYWLLAAFLFLLAIYPCSLVMPPNKKIYTITFLFAVLSTSATILTLLLIVIDYVPQAVSKHSRAVDIITRPFTWLGMNPLAIFLLLQILSEALTDWITINGQSAYQAFFNACFSWMGREIGSAIYALLFGIIYIIAAGLLYRAKIFIRL